ncbi:helix-turn-helix domain-containing protein [Bradyrhizobium sp. BR 1432]|uniref:helix-turn-helix domain-containing protein n=1 Tax=Bradyrhizobium sp. BR 1432 TaxID=3447966 RepID=UPI003EE5CF18
MKSPNLTFGKLVAALRQSIGLSQEELAERANIHRTYVSQIERGLKSPTIITLLKLSNALETTPSKLMKQLESELGLQPRQH